MSESNPFDVACYLYQTSVLFEVDPLRRLDMYIECRGWSDDFADEVKEELDKIIDDNMKGDGK